MERHIRIIIATNSASCKAEIRLNSKVSGEIFLLFSSSMIRLPAKGSTGSAAPRHLLRETHPSE